MAAQHGAGGSRTEKAADLVYGLNAVEAVLRYEPERVKSFWVQSGREADPRVAALTGMCRQLGIRVQEAGRDFLLRSADGGSHQGVLAELAPKAFCGEAFLEELTQPERTKSMLLLALDGVTDPHNLGAAMRSAWAAGAAAVIVPKDRAAPLTAAARKSASGAASALPLVSVVNLSRTLSALRDSGFFVAGLCADAPGDIYGTAFASRTVLVAGAEDSGLRRLTREKCDALLRIPMAGGVESLNVSVASAVALFEIRRQLSQNSSAS